MSNALTLYYSPGACSLAPHVALEEAGAAFDAVRISFADGEQRSPAFLAINPKARVPALVHDGFVVTENPAILRYIARTHPAAGLWPDDPRDEARCAEWLAWCASGLHVAYAHTRRAERYAATDAGRTDVVETGKAATRRVWEEVEAKLAASASDWVAGDRFSVADAYLVVFWTWGRGANLGYDMPADFPSWTAHARRVGARPGVQRAFAREGVALP